MLQVGDKVEEIATGRQGKIVIMQSDGSRGNGITTEWQVIFVDGTRKHFRNENELKSLMAKPEPGISPVEPLQK
jgi:hypothetical protein